MEGAKRITIRKIASDLNLAVSTVSKALRDSHEISEETKRLVLEYAGSLEYKPNPYAGSLKNRRTFNIAVVLPEVADTFFSNAINGIDAVAQEKGYHVMVYQSHEDSAREISILRELLHGRVDGVLVSVAEGGHNISVHAELTAKIPFVYFDRACEEVRAARVLTNDYEAAYLAAKHLIERGSMKLIYLAAGSNLSIVNERREGFLRAIADHQLSYDEDSVVACTLDDSRNSEIIRNVLRYNRPDGIVASVEKLAMQTYYVCREENLEIPGRVRIIAFSNLSIASLLAPSLSTVVQPAFEMGKAAASLLFRALEKKIPLDEQRIVIPSVIVSRDSTA
jgi:LacI family transcriptional regulator